MPLLRQTIDAMTQIAAWLRRGQTIQPRSQPVKINLGCGLTVASGWINVDSSLNAFCSSWPPVFLKFLHRVSGAKQYFAQDEYIRILKEHTFVHHQLEYGLPFRNESVDYLFASHVIEHFYQEDAEKLLREAHRVLRRGGRIRLGVRDLEHAFQLYQVGRKEEALSCFFTASKARRFGRYQYMYDFDLLRQLLRSVGFVDVERCSYRQGSTPDIDQLDNRPEQTLFVEARKPVDDPDAVGAAARCDTAERCLAGRR